MFNVSEAAYDKFMGRYSVRLAPVFADFAGIEAGQRVLDVGAGTGALTAELARRDADVAAAEPAPSLVAALRSRLPSADVRQAGAEDLPWPDASFDAALAQLVVTFMSDAPAGVAEMRRVVRPGGVVAICMWDRDGMEMLAAVSHTQDELDVASRRSGQVVDRRAGVERLLPAGERLVHGPRGVEVALMRGKVPGLDVVAQPVAHADGKLGEVREHVEFRQCELVDAVDPHGVAKRDEVEPAAPPAASRDRAVLVAQPAPPALVGALDLGRERPLADPGHIRLC